MRASCSRRTPTRSRRGSPSSPTARGTIDGAARYRIDYRQAALVATLDLCVPHRGVAHERFSADGPLALLPQGERYGLIWTATQERAQALVALTEPAFVDELKRCFGPRASAVVAASGRRTFPLALELSTAPATSRSIAIGNAAQTLHPVAGQGVNLGLRDAHALARMLFDTPREAIGTRPMLDRYSASRRSDRLGGVALTHGLVALFGSNAAPLRWPRGVALSLLDACAPAKRAFVRTMLIGLR